MRGLAVVALLLLASATASADTQAAHKVQGTQTVQSTQGTQNTQIFGLPPLPVALITAGTLLQKVHSPIKLNTRVITDPPAQQQAPAGSTTAAADSVSYGQAAAPADATQQLYMSGNQPVSGGEQPVSGGNPAVPPGVTSWIQNPDGTITPLKWEEPGAQATADGSSQVPAVGDSQGADMPQEGHVISGTIIAGETVPAASVPMQQTFTGGSFNYTGPMSKHNVTYSTPDDTQTTLQDTSADATMVGQDHTPMVVAMPVTHPQQQQQQVWVPASQGTQMMQGYYHPGQVTGPHLVQGYYGQGQAGMAVSTTVGGMPMVGGQGKRGWGVRKTQGQGWGSGGMRPAGMMVPAGGMGQMQQGPMGQGYMGQMQQGPMGQGYMGQMQQGPMAQGMGPMQGQGGMMAGGLRAMGPGSMGQGQMTGPAPVTSSGSSGSGADDGSAQGPGPFDTVVVGNAGQQRPAAVMEPTVVIIDKTQQNGIADPQPTQVTVTPPQGQPGPSSSGLGGGPGPMASGPSMGQVTGAAQGPGGLARRPPAMIPVNGPQQGADGVMGGTTGGMDGDDNMNN